MSELVVTQIEYRQVDEFSENLNVGFVDGIVAQPQGVNRDVGKLLQPSYSIVLEGDELVSLVLGPLVVA